MSGQIPATNSVEDLQRSFQQVWAALKGTPSSAQTMQPPNLSGHRVTNVGTPTQPNDAVTLAVLDARIKAAPPGTPPVDPTTVATGTFNGGTISGRVVFQGEVDFPNFSDGTAHHCILFVNSSGILAVDENHLSYNDVLGELDIGFADKFVWFNQAALASPAIDVVQILGALFGSPLRVVIGKDDGTGIALRPNGTTLEIRLSGGGALTGIAVGAFGCNGAGPQAPVGSGAALTAYASGANGLSAGSDMAALVAKVAAIDVALKANGICG